MMGVSDKSGLPQPPHADRLMALLNQFAVGGSSLSSCVDLTGVMLSSSGSVFDDRRRVYAVWRPDYSIVKTIAQRKALMAKGFGIVVCPDLTRRL
jgi:hypothetical protein